jgi:signal transduction histidine kinase
VADLVEVAVGLGGPVGAPRRPAWWRRYRQVVLIVLTAVLAMISYSNVHSWLGRLVAVAGAAPVALVAVRPLVAWRVAWIAALFAWLGPAPHETAWPWHPVQILVFLPVLLVTAVTQRRGVLVWVWLLTGALVLAQARPDNGPAVLVLVTLLVVVGDQIGRRRQAQRELAVQEERSALLSERTRIARELHDVVAHHMSLIAVRAETAPYRLGELAGPVRAEFGEISTEARDAMTEMRRLLGVLRSDRAEVTVAPQPGLPQLAELVATARQAGATVQLTLPAEHAGVPPAVQLTAYRIVQEALANAARHAPAAPVTVAVDLGPEAVSVRVANPPPRQPPAGGGPGSGHGLVGMRERAAGLGGELTAGPTSDGGFAVHATLPLSGGAG